MTINDLKEWVTKDLQDRLQGEGKDKSYDEMLEAKDYFIDWWIPIYNYEILEVAMSNLWLACSVPGCLPVDKDCSPCKLITYNIYEYLNEEISVSENDKYWK